MPLVTPRCAGDIADFHLLAVVEEGGSSFPRRERCNRLPQAPAPLVGDELTEWIGGCRGRVAPRSQAECPRALPPARNAVTKSAPAAPRWSPATDRTDDAHRRGQGV